MAGWVYILASCPRGTLYTGATKDLVRRIYQHREGAVPGFSSTYGPKRPVHFEHHETMRIAIQREKNLKHWSRQWKIDLDRDHPEWSDLWNDIVGIEPPMRGLPSQAHGCPVRILWTWCMALILLGLEHLDGVRDTGRVRRHAT